MNEGKMIINLFMISDSSLSSILSSFKITLLGPISNLDMKAKTEKAQINKGKAGLFIHSFLPTL